MFEINWQMTLNFVPLLCHADMPKDCGDIWHNSRIKMFCVYFFTTATMIKFTAALCPYRVILALQNVLHEFSLKCNIVPVIACAHVTHVWIKLLSCMCLQCVKIMTAIPHGECNYFFFARLRKCCIIIIIPHVCHKLGLSSESNLKIYKWVKLWRN